MIGPLPAYPDQQLPIIKSGAFSWARNSAGDCSWSWLHWGATGLSPQKSADQPASLERNLPFFCLGHLAVGCGSFWLPPQRGWACT